MTGNKRTTADEAKSVDCENKKLRVDEGEETEGVQANNHIAQDMERSTGDSEFSKDDEESASDEPMPIQAQDEIEKAKQGEIGDLFAEASTLFAKTNEFLGKVETVLNKLHNNVQDYKSLEGLRIVKESMENVNKAVNAIDESRERFGECKIFALSAEMVEEIMKYVSFRDKKRLRLVSPAMYHLITPCDNRFLLWRINLNRGCADFGTILEKSPNAELHVTLPKSKEIMATIAPHLEKESDRIVELVGTLPVITQLPDAFKMINFETLSISSGNTSEYSYGYPNYSDAVPFLQRHADNLKTLCLSHFNNQVNKAADFEFKALKDLHFDYYDGKIDLSSDFIVSKCTDSLESLTLTKVHLMKFRTTNDYSKLKSVKKLTVDGNSSHIDGWSLPGFLEVVCPGIKKVVLKGVHLPYNFETFGKGSKQVVEELYMHNCRFGKVELSSLLNACSLSLKTLHIRQDEEYNDDEIDWDGEESEPEEEYDIIDTMLEIDFRLRNLQDLTFVTRYDDRYSVESLSIDLGSKLPACVNIVIKGTYEE